MFEIGFSELVLVFVVALLVLGPERLPKAARTLGRWTGQARSYVRHFTSELEREVQTQELAEQTRRDMAELQRTVTEATDIPSLLPPDDKGGEPRG